MIPDPELLPDPKYYAYNLAYLRSPFWPMHCLELTCKQKHKAVIYWPLIN
jgi:hypothetical protein